MIRLAETEISAGLDQGWIRSSRLWWQCIAVVGLVYLLKLVMVTTLFSILLAFVLEPLVGRLARIGIPARCGGVAGRSYHGRPGRKPPPISSTAEPSIRDPIAKVFRTRSIPRPWADLRAHTSKIEGEYSLRHRPSKRGQAAACGEVREAPGLSRLISAGSELWERSCSRLASCLPGVLSCLRGRIPERASTSRSPRWGTLPAI